MSILAVIAIILAFITAVGIACCVWVIAWLGFETTEIGKAITDKKRLKRLRYEAPTAEAVHRKRGREAKTLNRILQGGDK